MNTGPPHLSADLKLLGTNLAEVAYMIVPELQGSGLGAAPRTWTLLSGLPATVTAAEKGPSAALARSGARCVVRQAHHERDKPHSAPGTHPRDG